MTASFALFRLTVFGISIAGTSSLARAAIAFVGALVLLGFLKLLVARSMPSRNMTLPRLFVLAVIVGLGVYLGDTMRPQPIRFRRAEIAPPTNLAALRDMQGPKASGACELPRTVSNQATSVSVALTDGTTLPLPQGWRQLPAEKIEDRIPASFTLTLNESTQVRLPPSAWKGLYPKVPHTALAGPNNSTINITRVRNGHGRSVLMYAPGKTWPGRTCEIDRGETGAIWTFHERNQRAPNGVRPFQGLGDIMARSGAWYSVSIGATTEDELIRLASLVTDATLHTPRQTVGNRASELTRATWLAPAELPSPETALAEMQRCRA